MKLGYELSGSGAKPPLLFLHGFTGNRDSFAHVIPRLAGGRAIVRLDLPGHGAAGRPTPGPQGWWETLGALGAVVDGLEGARVDVVGYSQGARLALGLALARPERIHRLVLESGSPGLANDAEREARRAADDALAERLERGGLESFIAAWEEQPLFTGLRRLPLAEREALAARRRSHSAAGLAAALRGLGVGVQPSYWGELGRLAAPVLVVTGAEDVKFGDLGRRMTALFPRSMHEVVAGCGHVPNLEAASAYAALVAKFLG